MPSCTRPRTPSSSSLAAITVRTTGARDSVRCRRRSCTALRARWLWWGSGSLRAGRACRVGIRPRRRIGRARRGPSQRAPLHAGGLAARPRSPADHRLPPGTPGRFLGYGAGVSAALALPWSLGPVAGSGWRDSNPRHLRPEDHGQGLKCVARSLMTSRIACRPRLAPCRRVARDTPRVSASRFGSVCSRSTGASELGVVRAFPMGPDVRRLICALGGRQARAGCARSICARRGGGGVSAGRG